MKQLTLDLYEFGMSGEEYIHPQKLMDRLGIKYSHATPQSMGDCWWFWNCKNIPEKLPSYLKIRERDPMSCIGFGLNAETAQKLSSELYNNPRH